MKLVQILCLELIDNFTGTTLTTIEKFSSCDCPQCNVICEHNLRVQNEQFSEVKGFILRDTEKEEGPIGIRTTDPWITKRTLYHWAIWLADEWA